MPFFPIFLQLCHVYESFRGSIPPLGERLLRETLRFTDEPTGQSLLDFVQIQPSRLKYNSIPMTVITITTSNIG